MKDKIYVVEMSGDELGDMSIGYASSQAIASKMIASAESTEGFENCRFRAYQATLNQLEINDNTISFAEPKYREHPMTTEEIRANMDEDGYVHGNVLVRFSDMVGVDVEQFFDTIAEKLVGNPCLSDISYAVEDIVPEQNAIILEVSGNVDLVLEMDDMRDQRLIQVHSKRKAKKYDKSYKK